VATTGVHSQHGYTATACCEPGDRANAHPQPH
jgi:hypothetical protein